MRVCFSYTFLKAYCVHYPWESLISIADSPHELLCLKIVDQFVKGRVSREDLVDDCKCLAHRLADTKGVIDNLANVGQVSG